MTKKPKKMLGLRLMVFAAALLVSISAAGQAEALQAKMAMQPDGLNYAGIYALRQTEPNLTGTGVKFAVVCRSITYIDGEPQNDYQPSIRHNALGKRQLTFHDDGKLPGGVSAHSTAICSILLGQDPNAFYSELGQFYYQGVAPKATANIYEFWHFLTNNVFPNRSPDADIITVGIGSGFEDWWTRGIEALAEHWGLIVVAGIGNGSEAYDSVLYPAAGANAIGVGVVDSVNTENPATSLSHFALAYPEHSSSGPTSDGRCKPDIVAPGNCLVADDNEPNRYEPSGDFSSFSTPLVAGAIGLLVQKAKDDPNLSSAVSLNGGNCVIKAILLNSADKLAYWHKGKLEKDDDHSVPLDYIQGAGMLNAVGAYEQLIAGQKKPGEVSTVGWDNNLLAEDENPQNVYKVVFAEPNDKVITATVIWNRHYNSVYPFEPNLEKDANLRLELWAVDPNDPNNDYLLDYSDSSVDNVEHIYAAADANYINYEIVVSYSDDINEPNRIPATQRYGLAWSARDKQTEKSIFWYDLNADGVVNELDVTILFNNWLASKKTPDSYLLGDINADGTIDANDVEILLNHMNTEAEWYTE